MAHGNARLTPHGRWLLVQRVRLEGWTVAHAAKAMGVSRKTGHYWLNRYDTEGRAGLEIGRRVHTPHRTGHQLRSSNGCWMLVGNCGWDLTVWDPRLGCRPGR